MLNDKKQTGFAQTPNTIPWPPILIVSALVLASIGDWMFPVRFHATAVLGWLGAVLVGVAIGLMAWAFVTFGRARSNIRPDRAATMLLTSGPFALSRNPIYLAEAILLCGLMLWHGSVWYGIALGLFLPLVHHLAICREEEHLAARFGDSWKGYESRVRRWL